MTNKEIVKILIDHINNYDCFSDGDLRTIGSMKKTVNALSGFNVYTWKDNAPVINKIEQGG